jgi:arylsulfatase A-like enzyme
MTRIGILISLAVLFVAGCAPEEPARKPNVLFLAIDDLNDWTGSLGGHPQAKTPNIDRLASNGVLFTNAHCPSPLCNPSRVAIFTGVRPETTEIYSNSDRANDLAPGLTSLPAHFRANGYRTLTTGKTFPVGGAYEEAAWDLQGPGSNSGGSQGGPFTPEEYDRTGKPREYLVERLGVTRPLSGMYDQRTHHKGGSFDWGPFDLPDNAFSDGKVTDWAVEQLRGIGEEPFFMAVGYYRPHTPLYAPAEYFEPFPAASTEVPETMDNDLDDVPAPGRYLALVAATAGAHSWVLEAGKWPDAVAAYLACVHFVDTQVGRVLGALEESGQADNTIIVLWSDHGWHLGEKEHWGKFTGWEESTRVPLVILLPESMSGSQYAEAFEAGRTYGGAVNLIDLYPTLVELAGLPPVEGLAGRSLAPSLQAVDPATESTLVTFGRGNYTVVEGSWRYIHYFDGTEELYDMASDPNQYENLAGQEGHAATLARLKAKLPETPEIKWIARWRHYKMVEFEDAQRPPLLFDLKIADAVTDRLDKAGEEPEVIETIRQAVAEAPAAPKFVALPDNL